MPTYVQNKPARATRPAVRACAVATPDAGWPLGVAGTGRITRRIGFSHCALIHGACLLPRRGLPATLLNDARHGCIPESRPPASSSGLGMWVWWPSPPDRAQSPAWARASAALVTSKTCSAARADSARSGRVVGAQSQRPLLRSNVPTAPPQRSCPTQRIDSRRRGPQFLLGVANPRAGPRYS